MAWFISPTNSFTHCCKQGDTFLSCERSIEKVLCSIYKDVCYMLRWCIKPEFQKIDFIFLVIDIVEYCLNIVWILLEFKLLRMSFYLIVTYISRNMYFQQICKIYLRKQQPCWGFIFFIADYKYCEQSFNYTVGNNSIKKICTHFRYKLLTTAASSPIPCHYRIKNQLARFLRILSFHTIEQLVSSYITSASLNHKIISTRNLKS